MSKDFNISDLQDYLSEEVLLKYIKNELSDSDIEKVEFLLQHDKMYSDLLDGLMMMEEPQDLILEQQELNKKIDIFSGNIKKQKTRRYLRMRSIAALILVLAAFGGVLYFIQNINFKPSEIEIAALNDTTYTFEISEYPVQEKNESENTNFEKAHCDVFPAENIADELIIIDDLWILNETQAASNEDTKTLKPLITENVETEEEIEPLFYVIVDEKPEFPGGDSALLEFIIKNIVYPPEAKENRISGKIFLQFTIDVTGKVTDVKIAKGINPYLDKEALRVGNLIPDWKPAKHEGKVVPVTYVIPITFKL